MFVRRALNRPSFEARLRLAPQDEVVSRTGFQENPMANRHRGEVAAELDGRPRRLVLTLGALAELEDALGAEDLVALAERFSRGRLAARDAIRILAAGLRGA